MNNDTRVTCNVQFCENRCVHLTFGPASVHLSAGDFAVFMHEASHVLRVMYENGVQEKQLGN